MSLYKNSHFVLLGGFPADNIGRALGPYRIRTVLENHNFTCSIIDYVDILTPVELEKIINYTVGSNTLAVGLSMVFEINVWSHPKKIEQFKKLISKLKDINSNIKIIVGAVGLSRIPPDLLNLSDWLITGYSEISLPKLLNHLVDKNNEIIYYNLKTHNYNINLIDSNRDYIISDMHQLFTRFHSCDKFGSYQPITIEISRGCVFNCSFCAMAFKNKKIIDYVRSPKSISEEFRRNYELFGTTRYMLADDTFNDSLEKIDSLRRAVDMAKLPSFEYVCYIRPEMLVTRPAMIDALADSGIRGAHYGIESGNNSTRKLMNRPISIEKIIEATALLKSKASMLRVAGSLIIGLPGDTKDDPARWNEYFVKNQPHFMDHWYYASLYMRYTNIGEPVNFFGQNKSAVSLQLDDNTQSPIEKNPSKYGYTIRDIYSNGTHCVWENEHMNFNDAIDLAAKYNYEPIKYFKFAGWKIAAGWYYNIPDSELYHKSYDELSNQCYSLDHRKKYWLDIIDNVGTDNNN